MNLSAWRIVQERHAKDAFSGEGARRFGGRWNSPGVAMVYTAQSRALAVLEILVHLDSPRIMRSFVMIEAGFEDSLVLEHPTLDLPADWRDDPVPLSTQAIGDRWIADGSSPVLRVPSALIPEEANFLLNPRHPDFTRLSLAEPRHFVFDPRLHRR